MPLEPAREKPSRPYREFPISGAATGNVVYYEINFPSFAQAASLSGDMAAIESSEITPLELEILALLKIQSGPIPAVDVAAQCKINFELAQFSIKRLLSGQFVESHTQLGSLPEFSLADKGRMLLDSQV